MLALKQPLPPLRVLFDSELCKSPGSLLRPQSPLHNFNVNIAYGSAFQHGLVSIPKDNRAHSSALWQPSKNRLHLNGRRQAFKNRVVVF